MICAAQAAAIVTRIEQALAEAGIEAILFYAFYNLLACTVSNLGLSANRTISGKEGSEPRMPIRRRMLLTVACRDNAA
jgi:hypothetical protein